MTGEAVSSVPTPVMAAHPIPESEPDNGPKVPRATGHAERATIGLSKANIDHGEKCSANVGRILTRPPIAGHEAAQPEFRWVKPMVWGIARCGPDGANGFLNGSRGHQPTAFHIAPLREFEGSVKLCPFGPNRAFAARQQRDSGVDRASWCTLFVYQPTAA